MGKADELAALRNDLLRLPDDTETREFEKELTELIRRHAPDPAGSAELRSLLDRLAPAEAAPVAGEEEKKVRYSAVYALCLLARRDHNPRLKPSDDATGLLFEVTVG